MTPPALLPRQLEPQAGAASTSSADHHDSSGIAEADADDEPPSRGEQPRFAAIPDPVVRALVAALEVATKALDLDTIRVVTEELRAVASKVEASLTSASLEGEGAGEPATRGR